MENHHFQWENPLEMVIFNSYVKLPEGTICQGRTVLQIPAGDKTGEGGGHSGLHFSREGVRRLSGRRRGSGVMKSSKKSSVRLFANQPKHEL